MDDLEPYQSAAARLYGLPVFRSKWLGDDMFVVSPRKNGKSEALGRAPAGRGYLTVNEFRRLRAEMDYKNVWFTNTNLNSTNTSTVLYANYPSSTGDAYWFWDTPKEAKEPEEGTAKPETDMQWLKRRIAEVSWVPA